MDKRPIGIFDSGVGGTSIWKEIHRLLPGESSVYLADSKNAPYGEKSRQEIIDLSRKNTKLLIERGCKLIVVACNTATTTAISQLRAEYELPFIGIEPAIKPAALQSATGTVGVLATKGTLSSQLFNTTSQNHAHHIEIVEQEGKGLVRLIEAGRVNSEETRQLLQKFLQPMLDANMDHLVLGCTHYPYLIPELRELLPDDIKIIDCGEAVARQTKKVLEKKGLSNTSEERPIHQFYSNSDVAVLSRFLEGVPGIMQPEFLEF
ncbi:glutamate racemase [Poritiphilus flavus]|uniref:Glutamate racemase n=1 Tax=Poritiphilus flavus TaxID=2697053 RepID=A0A6L9EGV7_9FLAO|nr:glutamate racemase [Poritiphilus flavus]NAS13925.1 glutamate racemase [Poritiphilus flavus]